MAEEDLTLGVVIGLLLGIPLGIGLLWAFTHYGGGSSPTYRPVSPPPVPLQTNKEVWEWVDWRGRKRTATVYREVKA